MDLAGKDVKEARWREKDKAAAIAYEEYRKTGLTLMTTIIGLSSGCFYGLFQKEELRSFSFCYAAPIGMALLQQLSHYLASKSAAQSAFETSRLAYDFVDDDDYMSSVINRDILHMES